MFPNTVSLYYLLKYTLDISTIYFPTVAQFYIFFVENKREEIVAHTVLCKHLKYMQLKCACAIADVLL